MYSQALLVSTVTFLVIDCAVNIFLLCCELCHLELTHGSITLKTTHGNYYTKNVRLHE